MTRSTPIKLLVINPGSTSTKMAVYENENPVFVEMLKHSREELQKFTDIWEQYDFRKRAILDEVKTRGHKIQDFTAVVSRGGTMRPIPGGIYEIGSKMLSDTKSGLFGKHVCNVGCQIAADLGQELAIPALTVDPPACDEFCAWARYSGVPQIERRSSYHALNQKATARKLAKDMGEAYSEIKAIIVHLGGGISIGAHYLGNVIDVNNALDGDGPFSPERAGSLPVGDLIKLCFSGKYSTDDMQKLINGKGGLVAYLNTTDGLSIEERINGGDETAAEVIEAMAYQVAKEIGAMASVLKGEVDAIALTGGLANWKRLVGLISERVQFIAPIHLYPGENEIESLALGALRFLRGEEPLKIYAGK